MGEFGLLAVMVNVVLPVFLIAGVGFASRRALALDPRPLARLSLYVLVPALLFHSLVTTTIGDDEILRIGAYAVLLTLILVTLGMAVGRLMGATRSEASALALSVGFMNAANYGLPVNLFAFGQDGFDRAVVFVMYQSLLTFSVAVFVAARGRLGWRQALALVPRMPVLWVGAGGLLVRWAGVDLPPVAERSVGLLATATVPVVILVLGMQIAGMRIPRLRLPVLAACIGRLGVSPLIGLALVAILAPTPLTAQVLVLEAAMPTAVNVTVLAAEFDAEPELVSGVALFTTALSVLTVSGWVAFLQSL